MNHPDLSEVVETTSNYHAKEAPTSEKTIIPIMFRDISTDGDISLVSDIMLASLLSGSCYGKLKANLDNCGALESFETDSRIYSIHNENPSGLVIHMDSFEVDLNLLEIFKKVINEYRNVCVKNFEQKIFVLVNTRKYQKEKIEVMHETIENTMHIMMRALGVEDNQYQLLLFELEHIDNKKIINKESDVAINSIVRLFDSFNDYFIAPKLVHDSSEGNECNNIKNSLFSINVEAIKTLLGKGVAIKGTVVSGQLRKGDRFSLNGQVVKIDKITKFGTPKEVANMLESVEITLSNISADEIRSQMSDTEKLTIGNDVSARVKPEKSSVDISWKKAIYESPKNEIDNEEKLENSNDMKKGIEKSIFQSGKSLSDNNRFKMLIEDVFSITGRGVVLSGKILQGSISVGDEVKIDGKNGVIAGIEKFRKLLDSASSNDGQIGLLVSGIKHNDVTKDSVVKKVIDEQNCIQEVTLNNDLDGNSVSNDIEKFHINTFVERRYEGERFDKNGFHRELAGRIGFALSNLVAKGFPILPGFVITTQSSEKLYIDNDKSVMWYYPNQELEKVFERNINDLESLTERKFGDNAGHPLLLTLSVSLKDNSMSECKIQYIGLNDAIVAGMGKVSGDEQWAWKKYCTFIKDYSCFVSELGEMYFKAPELQVIQDYKKLSEEYKDIYKRTIGKDFPQDVYVQLHEAITALYREWTNPRNVVARKNNGCDTIAPSIAIVCQMMPHPDIPYGTSGCTLRVSKNAFDNSKEYIFINKQDESVSSFADYSSRYFKEAERLQVIMNRLDENVSYKYVDFVCEGGFWYIIKAELTCDA